jgi:hypothetical protein
MDLPPDYLKYLESGGAEFGLTEGDPGYFALWHPQEIEANNAQLEMDEFAPGFLGFGTNGGGELLAFDCFGAVFMLPMIGMEPECAKRIANNWTEISLRIKK